MKILAIETSCDETGLAIIEAKAPTPQKGGRGPDSNNVGKSNIKVLENLVRSQVELHKPYGGVFPNLAKREHIKVLPELLKKVDTKNIDLIAVTEGPGLSPCLWAGINFAEELAKETKTPLVGINHLKGHIYIVYPGKEIAYPTLSLIVSGGHTELVASTSPGQYEILGRTRDDAAGEAFDKVARLLGLAYPGGPEISRAAEGADDKKFKLPRPMISSKNLDFSFAGLKTAVMYLVKGVPPHTKPLELNKNNIKDLAASFQKAVVEVLVSKTIRAAKGSRPKTIILGGGVAANKLLRAELEKKVREKLPNVKLILPDPKLTTDNALMIALAAWYERDQIKSQKKIEAQPNLKISQK